MEKLLKLTKVWYDEKAKQVCTKPILIGVESIISIIGKPGASWGWEIGDYTEVSMRAALVERHDVKESVEEIYLMYKA